MHIDTRQGWEHTYRLVSGETRVWQGSERFLLGVKEDIHDPILQKAKVLLRDDGVTADVLCLGNLRNVAEAGRGISNPNG